MKSTEEEGLDNLFKQGLQEPGNFADYRESDWDALEQMLDERGKKRPVIFWLRIASGIAAVLLLAFGWLYMQSDNTKITKQPLAVHKGATGNGNSATPIQTNTAKQDDNTVAAIHDNKDNTGTSGGDKHQIAGDLTKIPSSVNHGHKLAMGRTYRKDKSFFPLSGTAARRDTAGLVNDGYINNRMVNVLAAISDNNINAFERTIADLPSLSNDTTFTAAINFSDKIKGKNINPRRPQYALTILAAPNINGVSTFREAEVGGGFGLQFSMSIAKFTFSTGASYAKAPYLTPFADYHTSYPFKYAPVDVSADCRVLDIPLNVDYLLYSKARNQFSVGSGLSSYIMLNEDYHYNYAKPYNYTPTDYSVTNQNQHFLGVLNLQATYLRKLNSKVSLAVQPYLKIPLTGIGASQVRLQTAGVAFGLKWNLNSLAKP
jgi:hypothetical protein